MEIQGNVTAINTIVAGNKKGSAASDVGGSFNASSHHNLIGTGGSGGLVNGVNGNVVGVPDAKLGPLAWNGGPTQTAALMGSPAFNAGAAVAGVTTDQRGVVASAERRARHRRLRIQRHVTESLVVTATRGRIECH